MRPDLDAIRARCEAATEPGWFIEGIDNLMIMDRFRDYIVCMFGEPDASVQHDAEFIAAARSDVPVLLDYIRELEDALAEAAKGYWQSEFGRSRLREVRGGC